MLQRLGLIMIFLAACFCGSADGQVHAGCMQGPGCGAQGTGSGSNSGGTKPASNPPNPTAAAMNAMQNNLQNATQIINNTGAAILNALQPSNNSYADTTSNSSDDNSTGQPYASAPAPAALEAANAEAASQRDEFNAEAAQILQESKVDMASMSDRVGGGTAAAVNSLLDSVPPANNSNSAISALLGDSAQPNAAATSTANAVSNLLDINKVSDSASAFPAYIPLAPPEDTQFASAMQESVNQSDPNASASLLQSFQGAGQQVNDQLTGIVGSSRALASSVLDNRFVQWAMSDKGSFTTAPLPVPSDSPNTAANLVYAQSVVGFGTILKQCVQNGPSGCIQGIKGYGTAMVNQMGAVLGYAQVNIVDNPNQAPNN